MPGTMKTVEEMRDDDECNKEIYEKRDAEEQMLEEKKNEDDSKVKGNELSGKDVIPS